MKKKNVNGNDELSDIVMCLIVIFLFLSFVLLEQIAWGRYFFLVLCFCAYIVCIVTNNGVLDIRLDAFQYHAGGFIIVTLLSSVWAIKSNEPIEKVMTILETVLCFYPFYEYFCRENKAWLLIRSIKWSGLLLAVYTIRTYGISSLLESSLDASSRLAHTFSNVNQIAQILALACIIMYWELLNTHYYWQLVWFIPCFLVIFATQSRKGFSFILIGFLCLTVLNGINRENNLKRVGRIFGGICILVVLYFALSKISYTQGILQRMQSMINLITNEGEIDGSAMHRAQLIDIGIDAWKKNPIVGVGIGCSHHLAKNAIGLDYYLHNNYVELLSGGGLVGFLSYYWLHPYLLVKAWNNRRNSEWSSFIITWILLIIIMDYGKVSFYSKIQWFILLAVCVGVESFRKGNDKAGIWSIYSRN